MKEILNHPVGLRLTDDEWNRLHALKTAMGVPSLPNTTLCHDLLAAGLAQAESKRKGIEETRPSKPEAKRKRGRSARRGSRG